MTQPSAKSARNAALVGAGILLSRLVGLARQKLFAHYLGNGLEAAAFQAATRIPNVLQNLLGEGVLSASFIPVYAGLRAKGDEAGARKVANAVFALLSLVVAAVVALGLLGAPWLVRAIAPGYDGEAYALTVTLTRIIFPGTGVLVLSAWCLGILNSHRRFFLSYAAPVVWNGCIIAALVLTRGEEQAAIATWAAWGTVAGSVAQFAVQLPTVISLLRQASRPAAQGEVSHAGELLLPAERGEGGGEGPDGARGAPLLTSPRFTGGGIYEVVRNFVPSVLARGVVQLSSWVDVAYASLLSERAVAALAYAQTIAVLPVSLFGMAISAAELPELSADAMKSREERNAAILERLRAGLLRMSFFVVPSAVGFLTVGDLIAQALLESGRFTADDSRFTWYLLMGSGVALTAQTQGRLYSSAFYALKDTRTPLKFAAVRVTLGIALGYPAVHILPGLVGLPSHLGAVFITVTTGLTAWLELTLLRRALRRELGALRVIGGQLLRVWPAALIAGSATLGVKALLGAQFGTVALSEFGGAVLAPVELPRLPTALALLVFFGGVYGVATLVLRVPQATALLRRFKR